MKRVVPVRTFEFEVEEPQAKARPPPRPTGRGRVQSGRNAGGSTQVLVSEWKEAQQRPATAQLRREVQKRPIQRKRTEQVQEEADESDDDMINQRYSAGLPQPHAKTDDVSGKGIVIQRNQNRTKLRPASANLVNQIVDTFNAGKSSFLPLPRADEKLVMSKRASIQQLKKYSAQESRTLALLNLTSKPKPPSNPRSAQTEGTQQTEEKMRKLQQEELQLTKELEQEYQRFLKSKAEIDDLLQSIHHDSEETEKSAEIIEDNEESLDQTSLPRTKLIVKPPIPTPTLLDIT